MELNNSIDVLKKKINYKNIDILHKKNKIITFLNPYSYLFFRKNTKLFQNFNLILIDGISLVILCKIITSKIIRYSFDMTSIAPIVFNYCISNKKSIYFIGSREKTINNFIGVIKDGFPDLEIIGFRNGYFENEFERENTIKQISQVNPDVIIVGMGTPYQEEFLIDLKKVGWQGTGYTCGGFIHQTAQGLIYYPYLINKFNLRWLYRIYKEPKLLKRYLFYYPLSFLLFLYDVLINVLKKNINLFIGHKCS